MAKLVLRVQGLTALAMAGALAVACGNGGDDTGTGGGDGDGDGDNTAVTPATPTAVDADGDGVPDGIDNDGDGIADVVGTGVDSDGDGVIDGLDTNGDGTADVPLPGFTLPTPSTGTGGTAAGTGGTASTASPCDGLAVVGGTDPLIDDFDTEDALRETAELPSRDNRLGSWFTANDMTLGATQTPEGDTVPQGDDVYSGNGSLRSTGSGFENWGALFGVSLNDNSSNACAYDASAFDGIGFWAKTGEGGPAEQTIRVAVPIPLIIPVARGGSCVGDDCDDSHLTTIDVTDTWQYFEIEWSELGQTWAMVNVYDFDPANISQITFGVQAPAAGPGAYDIIIDDLRFLGEGSMGAGGEGAM